MDMAIPAETLLLLEVIKKKLHMCYNSFSSLIYIIVVSFPFLNWSLGKHCCTENNNLILRLQSYAQLNLGLQSYPQKEMSTVHSTINFRHALNWALSYFQWGLLPGKHLHQECNLIQNFLKISAYRPRWHPSTKSEYSSACNSVAAVLSHIK